jgi:hypothetical protein
MAYESTPFDQYTTYGLTEAQGLLNQQKQQGFQYPSYVSAAKNAPTQQNYMSYTPNQPMAQVQTPDYQLSAGDYKGLMGGDYNALQTALQQPGEIAAKTAYDQGQTNLTNQMGGQGMYGSSIMANQARTALDTPYQNAMATNAANAAVQRYGMEQTGLQNMNTFNLSREQEMNKYGAQMSELQRNQNADIWKSNATEADRQMQYNQGKMNWDQSFADQQRQWSNQQAYEKYTYDLAQQQAQAAYQERLVNQALAISGQGAPLVNSAQAAMTAEQNRQAQAQIAAENASVASQNGWLGAGGSVLGGLLGNTTYQNGTWGLGTVKV